MRAVRTFIERCRNLVRNVGFALTIVLGCWGTLLSTGETAASELEEVIRVAQVGDDFTTNGCSCSSYREPCQALAQNASLIREEDEIWLIDTHSVPRWQTAPERIVVERHTRQESRMSSVDEFFREVNNDRQRMTLYFVHGYKTNLYWACDRGQLTYKHVVRQCAESRPVRFVIWAWPSEQDRAPLRDARDKACRADCEGEHLGWWLQRVHPENRVSLIGYSYGARVVLGGIQRVAQQGMINPLPSLPVLEKASNASERELISPLAKELITSNQLNSVSSRRMGMQREIGHQLSVTATTIAIASFAEFGGKQAELVEHVAVREGRISKLTDQVVDTVREDVVQEDDGLSWSRQPSYRVALVAAAMDRDWLLPQGRLGQSYGMLDSLLLINNRRDRAMRFYGLIEQGRRVIALGKQGIVDLFRLPDQGAKISQVDVARVVGTKHSIALYFSSADVTRYLRELVCEPDSQSRSN